MTTDTTTRTWPPQPVWPGVGDEGLVQYLRALDKLKTIPLTVFRAWARESMKSGKTKPFDDYERGCIQLILIGIKLIETQPGIMNEINSQNNDTRTI